MSKLNAIPSRLIGVLGMLAVLAVALPSLANEIVVNKKTTAKKHSDAHSAYVRELQPGTNVNPKGSGLRPKLVDSAESLTVAQCTGPGGVVLDDDVTCISGQVCSTKGLDGAVHRICIRESGK
jgi:hypothetical protein